MDPKVGTTLVELQADNPEGRLRPGAFAQVAFKVSAVPGTVRIPSTALLLGPKGASVAVVDRDRHAQWRPVTIGRDLGPTVEVIHGLSVDDDVIDSPPDALEYGDTVRVAGKGRPSG